MKKVNRNNLSVKEIEKLVRKSAFSQFVKSLDCCHSDRNDAGQWFCCDQYFNCLKDIHKHTSHHHRDDIQLRFDELKEEFENKSLVELENPEVSLNCEDEVEEIMECSCVEKEYVVLLFYHYVCTKANLKGLKEWQISLCKKLSLKGKVRLASEGINGTLEGCQCMADQYISRLINHLVFCKMKMEDFKQSQSSGNSFDDLIITVCSELCTLGIPPDLMDSSGGGAYLTPEEFHLALSDREEQLSSGKEDIPILLDIRNFYESKIGYFDNAIKPDLRKFSYFPEYVDNNPALFNGKKILTYCTGGIRCERASAYLKRSTNCSEVFQLKGGIHKYLEKYPNGFFKGKLFVFDNRYSIGEGNDVTSTCSYCPTPHDTYEPCSSASCHQLVLICKSCKEKNITSCCNVCAVNASKLVDTEECGCTMRRVRAPVETSLNDLIEAPSLK